MSDRFDGLAERYQRYRPRYPEAALTAIAEACAKIGSGGAMMLDVGAGTGISTRGLTRSLGPDWQVVGLEPNADMRETAVRDSAEFAQIRYLEGTAEALPAGDGEVAGVCVAQALHWLDRPVFYQEVERALRPGGSLFILFNDRDGAAPIFQGFEALMEDEVPDYCRDYRQFDYAGEIDGLAWTSGVERRAFAWRWQLDLEAFAELMASRSYAKPWIARDGEATVLQRLSEYACSYSVDGVLSLPYITRLVVAQKG